VQADAAAPAAATGIAGVTTTILVEPAAELILQAVTPTTIAAVTGVASVASVARRTRRNRRCGSGRGGSPVGACEPGRRYQQESSIHNKTSLIQLTSAYGRGRSDREFSTTENMPGRACSRSQFLRNQRPRNLRLPRSAYIRWDLPSSFGNQDNTSLTGLPEDLRLPILRFFRPSFSLLPEAPRPLPRERQNSLAVRRHLTGTGEPSPVRGRVT